MPTTLAAQQTGAPFFCAPGAVLTVTAIAGTVTIDWTQNSAADIANNVATWTTAALTLTAARSITLYEPAFLRVTGACTYDITAQYAAMPLASLPTGNPFLSPYSSDAPIYTSSTLPAASTVPTYSRAQIVVNGRLIEIYSDGTAWQPVGGTQTLYWRAGSLATPLNTLTGITAGQFALPGGNPSIPAALLAVGSRFSFTGLVVKRGATATATCNLRLGLTGTTADGTVEAAGFAATNNSHHRIGCEMWASSITSLTTPNWMTPNSVTTNVASDRAIANLTSGLAMSLDISAGNAADSYDLVSIKWVWEGS